MLNLQPIPNTELSDYAIMLLQNHNIHTVRDFMEAYEHDVKALMKIMNIGEQHIIQIINAMSRLYGPNTTTDLLTNRLAWKTKRRWLATGIESLDRLLSSHRLQTGSVWEICGPPNIGKTQMALTILVNVVMDTGLPVLYIDTKLDFSSQRVIQLLKQRNVAQERQYFLMQQIKVERSLTPQGILQILQHLHEHLQKQIDCVHNMSLVIIDSLAAVWYLLEAEQDRKIKRCMLSQLNHLAYKLAKECNLAVIFINLALPQEQKRTSGFDHYSGSSETNHIHRTDSSDSDVYDDQQEINEKEDKDSDSKRLQQVLGAYWQSVPSLRLLLNYASNSKEINKRIITVLMGSYLPSNISCDIQITERGIL